MTSRLWIRLALLTAATASGLVIWSFGIEPGRLTLQEHEVRIAGWPRAHEGFRVAALSDLHVGAPHMTLPKLEAIVAKTNAAKPDVIVLLGDYVIQGVKGGRFVSPEESARVLAGLKAPLGVWAVLGNHDWWLDGERVQRALEGAGISVLEDEAKPLSGRGPLWVAGLGDLWTRQADIAKALRRVPEKHPVLLLTHNPDVFPGVPAGVSLTLAGHTHGGQVALPFLGRPIVPSRYKQRFAYGLIEEDDRLLFVTGGLGTSILPVRFRVPPEVVVLTLRRRRLP